MREILFRGKRTDTGAWITGDIVHDYWIGGEQFLGTAIRYPTNGIYSFPISVDESTVGQYTGLKDKNGMKIFEGDLFKIGAEKEVFEVKFEHGCCVAYLGEKQFGLVGELQICFINVIGNIHDNSELIKA